MSLVKPAIKVEDKNLNQSHEAKQLPLKNQT
jgi:hypothetical protein